MVALENQQLAHWPPQVDLGPALHPLLPVEVVTRRELRSRVGVSGLSIRQRVTFNQVILCFEGEGVHHVDFEPIAMRPGTLLHVHPGQVQEFQFEPDFDAYLVVYRSGLDRLSIPGREWFTGGDVPSLWELENRERNIAARLIRLLRKEQSHFDGSPAYVVFMESLLSTLIARLHLDVGEVPPSQLPDPFVRFRRHIELNLHTRPTITRCAAELGYSTRTLDRACQIAVGQSAKWVLDDRIALEIQRLLAYTTMPISTVARNLGFSDLSGFSKFVRRRYNVSPTELREFGAALAESTDNTADR